MSFDIFLNFFLFLSPCLFLPSFASLLLIYPPHPRSPSSLPPWLWFPGHDCQGPSPAEVHSPKRRHSMEAISTGHCCHGGQAAASRRYTQSQPGNLGCTIQVLQLISYSDIFHMLCWYWCWYWWCALYCWSSSTLCFLLFLFFNKENCCHKWQRQLNTCHSAHFLDFFATGYSMTGRWICMMEPGCWDGIDIRHLRNNFILVTNNCKRGTFKHTDLS